MGRVCEGMRVCDQCAGKSCGPKGIAHCDEQLREDQAREERRLKPCPFCETEWEEDEEESLVFVNSAHGPRNIKYFVQCEECGAQGPTARLEYEARELWNERK